MRLVPYEELLVQIKQIEIEGEMKYMIEINLGLMNIVFDKHEIDRMFDVFMPGFINGQTLTLPKPMRVIPNFD